MLIVVAECGASAGAAAPAAFVHEPFSVGALPTLPTVAMARFSASLIGDGGCERLKAG
jgi:hypothetical protein